MIKAIETHYKGYRFRSRLEARWAVFFDACGYNWDYEVEGFNLDGIFYLPDFKIEVKDTNGDVNIFWFEVKSSISLMTDDEWRKVIAFSNYAQDLCSGYGDFIILDGAPNENRLYTGTLMADVDGSMWRVDHVYRGRPSFWSDYSEFLRLNNVNFYDSKIPYDIARSARFEHGEKG